MRECAIKYAAEHEFFDESQNSKFISQAEGDYGVLVGGRPETLVAIQAIRDSPIIGHGSFPEGMKYIQLKQDIQYQHGYSGSDEPEDSETDPGHSNPLSFDVGLGRGRYTRRSLLDLHFDFNRARGLSCDRAASSFGPLIFLSSDWFLVGHTLFPIREC